MQKITPCLWFDSNAEEAVNFYTGIFKNSKIGKVSRYGEAGHEVHGKPAGTVLTVEFELNGQTFTALNGGPLFKFNEAVSFQVGCESQDEVDYYWGKLSEGGDRKRSNVVGSKTNTRFPGRLSLRFCRNCCKIPANRIG